MKITIFTSLFQLGEHNIFKMYILKVVEKLRKAMESCRFVLWLSPFNPILLLHLADLIASFFLLNNGVIVWLILQISYYSVFSYHFKVYLFSKFLRLILHVKHSR